MLAAPTERMGSKLAGTSGKCSPTNTYTIDRTKLAYTVSEACAALGIKVTKLYELMATGQLKRVKLGARTLIPAESLRAFVASLPCAS